MGRLPTTGQSPHLLDRIANTVVYSLYPHSAEGTAKMPTVRETIRLTQRGSGGASAHMPVTLAQHSSDDPVETRAWLVWTAIMENGESVEPPARWADAGVVCKIASLKAQMRSLYPTTIDWSDREVEGEFMRPVYRYLKDTGNARVVARNVDGEVTRTMWGLAPVWGIHDRILLPAAPAKPATRKAATRKEKPVRPKDMSRNNGSYTILDDGTFQCGECDATFVKVRSVTGHYGSKHIKRTDRAKAPVVRAAGPFPCPDCGLTFATQSGLGGHRSVHTMKRIEPTTATAVTVVTNSMPSNVPTVEGFDLPGFINAVSTYADKLAEMQEKIDSQAMTIERQQKQIRALTEI